MDKLKETPLKTKNNKTRYGSRVMVGETPVLYVKSGKTEDFITATEIVEALYETPVDYIVFKKKPPEESDKKKPPGKLDDHET